MSEKRPDSILIANEESFIRDILSSALTGAGYNCVIAADGTEALARLSEVHFPLAILDFRMPGISGERLLGEIATTYPETSVIMLAAGADIGAVVEMMKDGLSDFLVKPVNPELLLVSVRRALEKRALLIENRNYRLYLEDKIEERTGKIRRKMLDVLTSLVSAMEAKDGYTSGHSLRVSRIAMVVADELGLDPALVEQIKFAGQVHDIGKIGVQEVVLNKEGELTDEEYWHITSHSIIGERVLKSVLEDKTVLSMVRHHHERYDGQGYPDGLSGEQIPLGARIIAAADTFDAMSSDRPYRKAMGSRRAISELRARAGSQFDPAVVSAFERISEVDSMFWGIVSGYK